MHKEGTAHVNTSTTGSVKALGVGTGGAGVGIGQQTLETNGTQQTIAASLVPPPPPLPTAPSATLSRKNWVEKQTTFRLLAGIACTWMAFDHNALLGIGVVVLILAFWKKMSTDTNAEYDEYVKEQDKLKSAYNEAVEKYQQWLNTRVCQRCGTKFDEAGQVLGNITEAAI